MITSQQGIFLKKVAALLFCLPWLFIFIPVIRNNLDEGIPAILFVVAYITVFSLGLPVWMAKASKEMYALTPKGDKWVRWLSVAMIICLIGLMFMGAILKSGPEGASILCSDVADPATNQQCIETAQSEPPVNDELYFIILYIFTFMISFIKIPFQFSKQ